MSAPVRSPRAWIDLCLLTGCWASGYTFTAMALNGIAPEWVVVLRQLVAAAMLIPLALYFTRSTHIARSLWPWLIALAIVGNVAPFYAISWGQQHVESGLTSILVTTMPLMTLAMAHVFVAGERMTPRRSFGFTIGLLGVALIVGPEVLLTIGDSRIEILAQFAILLGALLFAANAIIARKSPAMDIWMRAAVTNALAFVIVLPLAWSVTPPPTTFPGWWAVTGVLGIGIFASGLATVIYFRLIEEAGPTFMSMTNFLVPPVALLAGMIVLAERPGLWALGGLVLIMAGILIAETKARRA